MNNFKQWIKDNYSHNEMADMANHGCAGGVGGMIYYTETEAIYKRFAHELHEIIAEYKDQTGEFPSYIVNDLDNYPSFMNSMVWFCAEWIAHEITSALDDEEKNEVQA
jgi:hypothetical protein